MRETLATLRRYDRADQTQAQLLSTDILDWFLDQSVRGEAFMFHAYPVTQLFGIQNQLPEFMVETHQINSRDDAEDYVARLSKFGIKFDQTLAGMALREEKGIFPPDFVVDKVLEGMRKFTAVPPKENVLYTSFVERAAKVAELDAATRDALAAEVATHIETTVYPAYGRMTAFLERIRPKLTHDAGAWRLPDGDAFYAHELRGYTTTDYTPEQVHQLGLDQVAKISAEMRAILDAQGHTGGTVGEWMAKLNADPRFLYADTPEAREQILKDYQAIIDEVDAGMDGIQVRPPGGDGVHDPRPRHARHHARAARRRRHPGAGRADDVRAHRLRGDVHAVTGPMAGPRRDRAFSLQRPSGRRAAGLLSPRASSLRASSLRASPFAHLPSRIDDAPDVPPRPRRPQRRRAGGAPPSGPPRRKGAADAPAQPAAEPAGAPAQPAAMPAPKRQAATGWYTEGGLGAVVFLPGASDAAAVGPAFNLRIGRDLFSWLSVGIQLAASSHEATVPPPPDGEWFQLYRGTGDVRLGGRFERLALFIEGGVGLAMISSNVLGKVMITEPGENFTVAFQAGAGVEYQLENRHYAFGLAGDAFLLPQFDALRAIDARLYLRYTY